MERLVALHGARMDLKRVRRLTHELAEALEDPERAEEVEDLLARTMASETLQSAQSKRVEEPGDAGSTGSRAKSSHSPRQRSGKK